MTGSEVVKLLAKKLWMANGPLCDPGIEDLERVLHMAGLEELYDSLTYPQMCTHGVHDAGICDDCYFARQQRIRGAIAKLEQALKEQP